jgi:ribosomal protein L12E/L44/L45/RPP1/RPP2
VPTRIELLKQAGFSDAEIGDWATSERQRMQQAGFTGSEIDDEFGVTRPPKEIPAAFIGRLKQGNALHRILGAAGEYAQDYFGDEPLGFSPENTEALHKLGVVGDIIVPAAKPVDALLRSVPAGIAGLGAALGQAVEEGNDATLGLGQAPKGAAARDFAQLAQIVALLSGASGSKSGVKRAPSDNAALPRAEDFRNAAAAISGTPASFRIEQKLLRLWTDHGIPPAEVAKDALRDRTIGEVIRSDSEKIPDVYAGTNATATAASERPNVLAQLAEPAQNDSATVPVEGQAAPARGHDKSTANLDASEAARMTAGGEDFGLYEPPRKRPRPFAEDYPGDALTDRQGRLRHDIEGRPLHAEFIAGRRLLRKADERLSPDDIKKALEQLNINLNYRDPHTFRERIGGQYYDYNSPKGSPFGDITINTKYKSSDQDIITAHEFGHAIDHFSGWFSDKLTSEEIAELRDVYSDLRGGWKKGVPRRQPEDYSVNKVNLELVAEGLRAYMSNPNYFKKVAPKAAAKFRSAVNENPLLKKVIQLNSLGAIGLIGAGIHSQDRDDQ